jgi:NAD-dependent dihydropyrimidine dehydrogenase PreA subunit
MTRPASRGQRRRRRAATRHVVLDRRACTACRRCTGVCPNDVLRMIEIGRHRHAKVKSAEACTGCLACVRACEAGALRRRMVHEAG